LIELGAPPQGQTGAMIYFGTGRFLSADDRTDTTRQSFYGLLDRGTSTAALNNPGTAATGDTTCATPPATDSNNDQSKRNSLQEQVLSAMNANNQRSITSSAVVDYSSQSGKNSGWYIDLPITGERMVTAPTLLAGRIVFPTLIPSSEVCDGGGYSTVVAVDPFHGKKTVTNIFNISGSGITYDSFKLAVGVVKNVVAIDAGTKVFLFAGGSTGEVQRILTRSQEETGGAVRGRVSWREIVK